MSTKLACIALAAALAGCASAPGVYSRAYQGGGYYGNNDGSYDDRQGYPNDSRNNNDPRYYGGAEPCRPGLNAGHVVGGVVGGVLGNQVGKGNGRTAATVAGVAIGAMAGGNIARPPECR